ncbi:MAG: radical SAM protein [Acidimicrobiales bacterium]
MVRRWGRWFTVERPGAAPSPTDLDGLLARIAGSAHSFAAEPTPRGALDPADAVAPLWGVAGLLTPDGVVAEDPDGRPVAMGPDELRVLDALTGSTTVADLLRESGAAAGALERLVVAGKVVHGDPATDARWTRQSVTARLGNDRPYATVMDSAVHPSDSGLPGRTPVYALWHQAYGPQLGIGMVTAAARAHDDGSLNETFEIRRPELLSSIREDLERRPGPAVLLLSNFIWTIEDNLDAARELTALEPRLLVVHGGPSTPSYERDVQRFLEEHGPIAHVLVRGEGERTIGEVLAAVAERGMDPERLSSVAGIAFVEPGSGTVVSTPDRPRIAELDDLPSPYLTGEFDHLVLEDNFIPMALETNRGCPYGCTFCDWGSATNSRIRWFSLERVRAEIDWLASRNVDSVFVTDANFGVHSRDVETARHFAAARGESGAFDHVIWQPAKNTTKHLIPILRILQGAGVVSDLSIPLQTTDPATLEAIGRSNISTERLMELAREMRCQSIPVRSDLMLGLPGQTRESYRADLQLMFDQEIVPRTWVTLGLPNAPMNEPGYRSRFGISLDDHGVVVATAMCSFEDREMMLRLRRIFMAAEVYGVLRHLLRWLQWDHGLEATTVLDHLSDLTLAEPDRYPSLTWLVESFDLHPLPPAGWTSFYDDVRSFVVERLGIASSDTGLDCVLRVQQALMPTPGRALPATVALEHDYVGYYLDATVPLYGSSGRPEPVGLLTSRESGSLTVAGDPASLAVHGMDLSGDPRDIRHGSTYYVVNTTAHELDSPLLRLLPEVLHRFDHGRIAELTAERRALATTASPVRIA